ncbi:MAG: hypothetical protein HKO10_06470 [Acidimicrobiia bacterium]|nr:hypothetical protein [Acidimicrobiia bacterium]
MAESVKNCSGPVLFARYALPPNELGYCGPDDWNALFSYATADDRASVDGDLRRIGRVFHGALPYLELIAETTGIGDPFDQRVVHAYWVGNHLLERVPLLGFGNSLRDRFHGRIGTGWMNFTDQLTTSSVPHHSFHVFCVYPWVGLLRAGQADVSLQVLDRCRIRTGTVVEVIGDVAVVRYRPLILSGERIEVGPEATEVVKVAHQGITFLDRVEPGDRVSLHWDWVCDVISRSEADAIDRYMMRHLDGVNRGANDGVRPFAYGPPANVGP